MDYISILVKMLGYQRTSNSHSRAFVSVEVMACSLKGHTLKKFYHRTMIAFGMSQACHWCWEQQPGTLIDTIWVFCLGIAYVIFISLSVCWFTYVWYFVCGVSEKMPERILTWKVWRQDEKCGGYRNGFCLVWLERTLGQAVCFEFVMTYQCESKQCFGRLCFHILACIRVCQAFFDR